MEAKKYFQKNKIRGRKEGITNHENREMEERTKNLLWPSNILRMALGWTLAILYSYFQLFYNTIFGTLKVYPRRQMHPHFNPVCIVTGATSGLGRATAKFLYVQGYHVILAGRSVANLSEEIVKIEQKQQRTKLKALELDLCSEESIMKFKDSVLDWLKISGLPQEVQLLVNNAGVLRTSKKFTANGFESMMASNYLGTFKLTHLLIPLLQASKQPPRIVNVTSFTHRCVSNLQVDRFSLAAGDMQGITSCSHYRIAHIYETSKLCLLLFTFELHRRLYVHNRLRSISVMAADPGVVETCIFRELPSWLTQITFKVLKCLCLLQSPERGSEPLIDAALASHELSGIYFFGGYGRAAEPSMLATDKELARKLYEVSMSLCKL